MCLDYLSDSVDVNVKYGYKLFKRNSLSGITTYNTMFFNSKFQFKMGEEYKEEECRDEFDTYQISKNFLESFYSEMPYFKGFHSYLKMEDALKSSWDYNIVVKVELINIVEQGIQNDKNVVVSKGIKLIEEIDKISFFKNK